jgi:hypothetical protein
LALFKDELLSLLILVDDPYLWCVFKGESILKLNDLDMDLFADE